MSDRANLFVLELGSVERHVIVLGIEGRGAAGPDEFFRGVVGFRERIAGGRPRAAGQEHPLADGVVVSIHRPIRSDAGHDLEPIPFRIDARPEQDERRRVLWIGVEDEKVHARVRLGDSQKAGALRAMRERTRRTRGAEHPVVPTEQ